MKVNTLKQALMLNRLAGVTPFVWGSHGIGKSSIIRQLCEANGMGCVDMRLGQLEASDLRGLPCQDRENNRTIYLPPSDMPVGDTKWEDFVAKLESLPSHERDQFYVKMQPRLEEGILFLDEVNRGQDDVLQAVFQLVLDRRVGLYALPPGWNVVCAGNFMEGEYQTNGFNDAAFLDRFCHLTFSAGETTMEDWMQYMASTHGIEASQIIEFTSQNVDHLYAKVKGELGFNIMPTPRSWDAVARVEKKYKETLNNKELQEKGYAISNEARLAVIAGLIGMDLSMSYDRYDCPVKPKDLISNGVAVMADKLKKLNRNQMAGLVWGFVSFVKNRVEEEKISTLVCDFAEWLCNNNKDKDIVVMMCKNLVTANNKDDQVRAACLTNPKLAKLLARGSNPIKKSLIDALNKRPSLQKILSLTAWGDN